MRAHTHAHTYKCPLTSRFIFRFYLRRLFEMVTMVFWMLSESAFVFFSSCFGSFSLYLSAPLLFLGVSSMAFDAFTCRRFCLISFLYSSLTTINEENAKTRTFKRKSIDVGRNERAWDRVNQWIEKNGPNLNNQMTTIFAALPMAHLLPYSTQLYIILWQH